MYDYEALRPMARTGTPIPERCLVTKRIWLERSVWRLLYVNPGPSSERAAIGKRVRLGRGRVRSESAGMRTAATAKRAGPAADAGDETVVQRRATGPERRDLAFLPRGEHTLRLCGAVVELADIAQVGWWRWFVRFVAAGAKERSAQDG